jgi:uncharacterized membrane protein
MDTAYLFIWWLLFFFIGFVNLPLTIIFFKKAFDLGYGFSKFLGLLLISYLILLSGVAHLLPFTTLITYLFLLLLIVVNLVILNKNKKRFLALIKKKWRRLLLQEIIFTACLVGWSIVRAYQPDIRGLEKFMDLGFINSLLRSKYFPAPDMWFAGKAVNYYWFGHLITAVITRLSTLPSFVTYNLMIATILGFLANGTFSLVSSLVSALSKNIAGKAISAGLLSVLLVCFAGNFHTPAYVYKNGLDKYWYPDATRFIGYNPPVEDKTIHEFPIYSFVVSDLHAHLLGIPLVILFLGLLWNIASAKEEKSLLKRVSKLLLPGLVLAGMFMTNTWDFGNYLIAAAASIFFLKLIPKKFSWKKLWWATLETVITVSLLFIIGIVFSLPFILNFSSMVQGVKFVYSHTPIWQLLVLWGFPAVLTVIFLPLVTFILRGKVKKPDIFILSLLTASWLLVAIPEVIYIKDIYIASHYRANTMFKLTYQAYVMFYLSAGYIAVRTVGQIKKIVVKIFSTTFFTLLFTSLFIYPFIAVNSYYNRLQEYKGLNGEVWLKTIYPDIYETVLWFRDHVSGQPTILEAPGDSYTDYNVISSYTGLPTVQGWFVHEWLWRGGSDAPADRSRDVAVIYETASVSEAKQLLDKYQVKYVVVGTHEKEKYPQLNELKFTKIGKKVYAGGETTVYLLNN